MSPFRTIILCIFCLMATTVRAQRDTSFWFAAPDLQEAHGDRPIFLRASTDGLPAVITVTMPADPSFQPLVLNVPANSSGSLDLTPYIDAIENSVTNIPQNKALKISSTSIISCYYDIASPVNGDIYPLKGANALGFRFTLPFQMDFPGNLPTYRTSFTILATENNTQITITPKHPMIGHPAGVPFSITLQKGQTFTCEAASNIAGERPGGTVVEANKRVAISTKDDTINYLGYNCGDTAGDQLIPDCNAGTSFALMKGYLKNEDYYYVFALANGTTVSVNGTTVATINAGDYYRGLLSDPSCYIETNQPVHLFHISGFGCELGGAVVPSLGNEGSSSVSLTRASTDALYLNVLAPVSIIGSFTFNGSNAIIDASKFEPVPSTSGKWMTARIEIPLSIVPAGGNFQVINTAGKFHAGMIHGRDVSTCRYGYFSDFSRKSIELTPYKNVLCGGENFTVTASGMNVSNFRWTGPNGFISIGPTLTINKIMAANEGEYTVSGDDPWCGIVEKKIQLSVQQVTPSFDDLNGQCLPGNSFSFTSKSLISSGKITALRWSLSDGKTEGNPSFTHSFANPGKFTAKLRVTGDLGCMDSLEKVINVYAEPSVQLAPAGPIAFCSGNPTTLTANISVGEGSVQQIQWRNNAVLIPGAQTSTYIPAASGNYDVDIISTLGCTAKSLPVAVTIHPLPVGTLTLTGLLPVCLESATLLSVTGGDTYRWFRDGILLTGISGSTYQANQIGVYTVELISKEGCQDKASGSVTIAELDKPIASFGHSGYCLNTPTIFTNLTDISKTGSVKWEWDFGDGKTSSSFAPSHEYMAAGTYNVTLKSSLQSCPSMSSTVVKTVTIYAVDTSISALDPTSVCASVGSVRLQAGVASSYQWLFNGSVITGANSRLYTATTTGEYRVLSTNSIGCSAKSLPVTVAIHPLPVGTLTPTGLLPVCLESTTLLSVTGGDTYRWFRDGILLSGISGSTHKANQIGVYTVELISKEGCLNKAVGSVTLVELDKPAASFKYIGSCRNTPIVFTNLTDLSKTGSIKWEWNFGDGKTSSFFDPSNVYTAAGTYNVTLKASLQACPSLSSTDVKSVTIYGVDTSIIALDPTSVCASIGSVRLQAGVASTYQWLRNGSELLAASARLHTATITGDYRVALTNSFGCRDTSRVLSVRIFPQPVGVLDIPSSDLLCSGSSVKLQASGGSGYRWFLNGTQVAAGADDTYLATQPGMYTVKLVSPQGCTSDASGIVTLRLVQKPVVNFDYLNYCAGLPVQFSDRSTISGSPDGVRYSWIFGANQGSSSLKNPSYIFSNAGTYKVLLAVIPNGCPALESSLEKSVRIEEPVPGVRYPPVNAIANKPANLTARNIAVSYQWIPGIYLSNSLVRTPVLTTSQEQLYRIRMTSAAGCTTVDTQLVRVFVKEDIFVPTMFSPNGDQHNDKLEFFLTGMKSIRFFRVYNRWGQLLFETRDANMLWDGTFKGVKQPLETYTWIAECETLDGSRIVKRGQTVLIR